MASRLLLIGALFAGNGRAFADGGVVRWQGASGPFIITVFTSPAVLRVGPCDVSIMVQRRDSNEVVLDGLVDLFFVSPAGAVVAIGDPFCGTDRGAVPSGSGSNRTAPQGVRATHERATNKLLWAAPVNFPTAGTWRLRFGVRHLDLAASGECALPVLSGRTPFASVWPCFAVPPVLIGLFATHERLRRRRTPDVLRR